MGFERQLSHRRACPVESRAWRRFLDLGRLQGTSGAEMHDFPRVHRQECALAPSACPSVPAPLVSSSCSESDSSGLPACLSRLEHHLSGPASAADELRPSLFRFHRDGPDQSNLSSHHSLLGIICRPQASQQSHLLG